MRRWTGVLTMGCLLVAGVRCGDAREVELEAPATEAERLQQEEIMRSLSRPPEGAPQFPQAPQAPAP